MFWCEANFLWMKGLNELKINISVKSALQCNNYLQRKGRFIELIKNIYFQKCLWMKMSPTRYWSGRTYRVTMSSSHQTTKGVSGKNYRCSISLYQSNNFHQKFWSTTIGVFFLLQFNHFDHTNNFGQHIDVFLSSLWSKKLRAMQCSWFIL